MNKLNTIILILSILILVLIILTILIKIYYDKIKDLIDRLEDTEKTCHDKIKEKYNIIIRAINLIENKLKIESKTFDNIRKLKLDNSNSFKNEIELNKCFEEIHNIKEDNPKSKNLRTFKEIISDYDENELYIISLRTYYNKYIMIYNNTLKKFPYNIISKFKKYKLKLLFEGKEIEKED